MSKKKSRKKLSKYQISLLAFFLLLLIGMEAVLLYVNNSLKAYEKGDIDNYLNSLLLDIKRQSQNGNIKKYFELSKVKSDYEKRASLEKGYKELLKSAKLSYQKTDTINVYNLYADDVLLATVTLDGSKEEHRLGLLTYTNWEIDSMESYNENGLYNLEFYLSSNYTLYINDVKVKDSDLKGAEKIKEYEEVYDKVDLPSLNHYQISGLTVKPKIVIKDKSGKEIKTEYKDNAYYANDYFKTDDIKEAMQKLKAEYDPLKFARNWSLFLTDDLSGARHGFYTLEPNLMEGTAMYKRAYSWATGVDVTFTSIHTLDKETFTNEKVSNFTIYNENAFSVEVYLEKNMTLIDKQKKQDVLHDIFYYVYYDNAYRLVHMQTVA